MSTDGSQICVFTSYRADAEPRAVKHAAALATAFKDHSIRFVDCLPQGSPSVTPQALRQNENIFPDHCFFPHRANGLLRLVVRRSYHACARAAFAVSGRASPAALSTTSQLLFEKIPSIEAECFIGHNIDCLPVLGYLATRGVPAVFDCMEYYSGMENQSVLERRMIKSLEQAHLPRCALVLAASDEIADVLASEYGIPRPLVLHNCPRAVELPSDIKRPGFNLYWRNAVLGFGGRGLDDALVAMTKLPADVILHLQGRPASDPTLLPRRIAELGLSNRVIIHQPYQPHEAVLAAAPYTIGLCLERDVCPNYQWTVSNKVFDYFMARLAVVVSDMPSLSRVVNRTAGGLTFRSGDPDDLARKIMHLYENRAAMEEMAERNRRFALAEGNEAHEMGRFIGAVKKIVHA